MPVISEIRRGGVRGAVATGPMSAVFLAQRRGKVPPEAVTTAAARRLGFRSAGLLWPVAHLAFGTVFGAAAEVLGLPRGRTARTAYGLALFLLDTA